MTENKGVENMFLQKTFNRILDILGLITKKRAIYLATKTHMYYVKCVINGVHKDFGCPPIMGWREDAETYYIDVLNDLINYQTNNVTIATESVFTKKTDKGGKND